MLRHATCVLVTVLVACATPVGVRRVDERTVRRTLTSNVLSAGLPSVASRQVLLRLGLESRFVSDPEGVLAELHARVIVDLEPAALFAAAEYAFLHASNRRDRAWFIAASAYAFAYLFPDDPTLNPDPMDPRLRTAVDLYNRSLAAGLVSRDHRLAVREGTFEFPLGEIEVEIDPRGLEWADHRLDDFEPAAELEVRGLRNRYRRKGIGAPFVAATLPVEGRTVAVSNARILSGVRVPVTFFLRYQDAAVGLRTGHFRAALEAYSLDVTGMLDVAGRRVPIEFETSSALAYGLERSRFWDLEIAGFLSGDAPPVDDQLFMLRPYVPGRIPVVLVHGTASSPARWAEMLNELQSDSRIDSRYQFWLFVYSSGNPVLFSAALLRDSLRQTVAELDPGGRDPALRRMVLVGHSQGGLLVKLQVVSSGYRFWENLSDVPFDDFPMQPATRAFLARIGLFEPLPFVERVVFIATPHRGSFIAGNLLGSLASDLVRAPQTLARAGLDLAETTVEAARDGVDLLRGDADARLRREMGSIPTSVDNMKPGHRFIVTLADLPIAPGVEAHSIIPVEGSPPPEGQDDGVVEYESAHIDDAVSEYVVFRSGHSTQSDPRTIEEVRRILRQQLVREGAPE